MRATFQQFSVTCYSLQTDWLPNECFRKFSLFFILSTFSNHHLIPTSLFVVRFKYGLKTSFL